MSLKTALIEVDELAALPPDETLIVDCRFDLGDPAAAEESFRAGHVPGAVYASLDRDLSDLSRQPLGLGRHPLPLEAAFSSVLSRWGWHKGMQIVSYDTAGGALAAARLWWLLKLVGVEAAVLDGGYAAWQGAGLPVEQGAAKERAISDVARHYDPARVIVDHASLGEQAACLIDARAAPRYRGDVEPLDRVGGHVPGAVNRPFADNLAADGRFKPAQTLRNDFDALLGGKDAAEVVHMCGSGVTACHNLLAMEHAGLIGSRLYAPSWSGWISDASRPVAKG